MHIHDAYGDIYPEGVVNDDVYSVYLNVCEIDDDVQDGNIDANDHQFIQMYSMPMMIAC